MSSTPVSSDIPTRTFSCPALCQWQVNRDPLLDDDVPIYEFEESSSNGSTDSEDHMSEADKALRVPRPIYQHSSEETSPPLAPMDIEGPLPSKIVDRRGDLFAEELHRRLADSLFPPEGQVGVEREKGAEGDQMLSDAEILRAQHEAQERAARDQEACERAHQQHLAETLQNQAHVHGNGHVSSTNP